MSKRYALYIFLLVFILGSIFFNVASLPRNDTKNN